LQLFFFAAREVVGWFVHQMSGSDLFQRFQHPSLHFIARQTEVEGAEGDIIKNRRHEQLVVRVLKNHSDRPPDLRQGRLGEGKIADADFPGSWGQITVQMQKEGRLTRSVSADDP